MSTFDIVLLILVGLFMVNGLYKGLIKLLGNIAGLIVGAYVSSHYYLNFYALASKWSWLNNWMTSHENFAKVLVFIILFALVTRLTALLFLIIEKIFNLIAIIPGSKYINNLLGAALGLLEGALSVGLIIYVISRYTLISNFFGAQLTDSFVAPLLLKVVNIILPILPDALKALQAII